MSEDITLGGYNVPAGTFIFANMTAMSRMDEYYPEPEQYHPERWLRDDRAHSQSPCKKDAGFLSLPFSHGQRACPGKRFAEQGLYLAIVSVS
jgi:cytochrome P450